MMEVFNEIKTPADPKQGGGFVGKAPADNLPQNSTRGLIGLYFPEAVNFFKKWYRKKRLGIATGKSKSPVSSSILYTDRRDFY